MKSLLLLSQLVIPEIPSNTNHETLLLKSIKKVSCVRSASFDGLAHSLDGASSGTVEVKRIVVRSKDRNAALECAEQVLSKVADSNLNLQEVFPSSGTFLLNWEIPLSEKILVPGTEEDGVVSCLAIGHCPPVEG